MNPDTAKEEALESAVQSGTLARLRALVMQHAKWVRLAVLCAVGLAVLAGIIALVNELALARVPQNRASLERLIRAHTGLDMSFNELTLRWGWYGPEAVFRGVELGEPGGSTVLLRAPQLIVGFDAWRTIQSGQIAPGRITLVAPDIDLDRSSGPARRGSADAAGEPDRLRLLQRWRGGRLDIEGGTLRLPDPLGTANALSLQLRQATLRRVDDEWSASALVFLPDRLGRTARITLQWTGDPQELEQTQGRIRFEGVRLVFPGWRELLAPAPRLARLVPVAGGGDISLQLEFDDGRPGDGSGRIRAHDVQFRSPALADPTRAAPQKRLAFERLRADWTLSGSATGWKMRIEDLDIGDESGRALPPLQLQIEPGLRRIRGELSRAPLSVATVFAAWFAPHLDFGEAQITGTAHDIEFDWNSLQESGRKLYVSARCENVAVRAEARGFELAGLAAQARGNESEIAFDVDARDAQLTLASKPDSPLRNLRITSRLELEAAETGWQLTSERVALEHEGAQLVLDGSLAAGPLMDSPRLDIHGVLLGAEVGQMQRHFGDWLVRSFGDLASRLTAGRIEKGEFELASTLDALAAPDADALKGSLRLRDASLGGGESWPDLEALDAEIRWNGPRIQARADAGQAGSLQLTVLEAQWDVTGKRPARITGEFAARLEDALSLVRQYPGLSERVPQLQNVLARGDAEFDFQLSLPAATETPVKVAPAALRFTALFDSAQLQIAPELPLVEKLRGSIAFDSGRIQRSTLTGSWLGGPVTLRIAQGRNADDGTPTLSIEARGLLDAQQLAALTELPDDGRVTGQSPWHGDLLYHPPNDGTPARVRARLEASLEGVTSRLPEPFAKVTTTPAPLRLDLEGTEHMASVRIALSDRLRAAFDLERPQSDWRLGRGAVQLGGEAAVLPTEQHLAIAGSIRRLDVAAYAGLLERLRGQKGAIAVQLDLTAKEMLIAGRAFPQVSLHGQLLQEESALEIDSEALKGAVRWGAGEVSNGVAEVKLARLALPPRVPESSDSLVVLTRSADVSVDELSWEGRTLGALNAQLRTGQENIRIDEIRLAGETHDVRGTVQCQSDLTSCRGEFELESRDAARTLTDFGFRPELSAARAALTAELQWQPESGEPWLQTLSGQVHMRLTDGITRSALQGEGARTFPLLTVPAILQAAARVPEPSVVQPGSGETELSFARLEGDFRLAGGRATTSDLHFDGDAEILVRGHANLLTRDYDFVAWILRGRERLPEALRRFGDAPRVAAAWLALREMFGDEAADQSRTVIRLRGSWDEPVLSLD